MTTNKKNTLEINAILYMAAFVGIVSSACDTEPSEAEPLAEVTSRILMTGNVYPDRRSIPACWSPSSWNRDDFAPFKTNVESAIYRSWTQATGLTLVGVDDPCPDDTNGMIHLHMKDPVGSSNSDVGYRSHTNTGVSLRSDSKDHVFIHEFGHALGFAHEFRHPDFPEGSACKDDPLPGDTLNTPGDWASIMNSTYCNSQLALSYWDRIGVQHAYGFPNHFPDLGNGRASACLIDPTGVHCRVSTGSAFPTPEFGSNVTEGPWYGHKGTFFANLDGLPGDELIAVDDTGVYVRTFDIVDYPASSERRWIGTWYGEWETFFADVDGDGKSDIIGIDGEAIAVRMSNGSSFPGPSRDWGDALHPQIGTYLADVAGDDGVGDGMADLIYIDTDGTYVSRSNGSSFEEPVAWIAEPIMGQRGTHFADVNADALADLITVENNGIHVRLSTGSAFGTARRWVTVPWWGTRGTFFADVDGGGEADLIGVDEDGIYVALSNGSSRFSLPSKKWSSPWYAD